MGVRWYLCLVCLLLRNSDAEHLFKGYWSFINLLWRKCLFETFHWIFNEPLCLFVCILGGLYILDSNLLSDTQFANIFSILWLPFTLLTTWHSLIDHSWALSVPAHYRAKLSVVAGPT